DHRNTRPVIVNGPIHAAGVAGGPGHGVVVPPYTPVPGAANDGLVLELWYEGADSLAITLRSPRGESITAVTGDSASLAGAGGAMSILNAVDGPAPGNGDHGAVLAILDFDAAAPPDSGRWEIEVAPVAVHAAGEYHLWLTGHSLSTAGVPALTGGVSNRYVVGAPASADRVLAAGGHVTRHAWTGLDGEIQSFPGREDLGDIAYFSSPGPRRDGVPKPDITAPSKVLISSLSKDATLWDGLEWLIQEDSVHVGLLGTSMAAPQVAAAVAVLLQLEPDLEPEGARDVLRLSAATDAFVPAWLPDPVWGAGKLDAAAAAERLRPSGLPGQGADVALSSNPVRGDALVVSYSETPRSVAVYTLIAERVRTLSGDALGPLTTVWALDTDRGAPVANGAYVLVVEFEDRRVVRKLLVARP
ncbi:MAG TPA: S8 family serine peptidase, partial [Longimicrobiales bacterium]|nr:S8 family serine peptidase [Longimicrobiales bacterium]